MMPPTSAFVGSAQIRAARALLNWSQEQLAEAAGLSVATIRKIEAGNISPRDSTMLSIAAQTTKNFSATQFALFSSLFALPRSITGVIAGFIVEKMGMGWTNFFLISAATALPAMALLYWVAPWSRRKS